MVVVEVFALVAKLQIEAIEVEITRASKGTGMYRKREMDTIGMESRKTANAEGSTGD